MSGVKTFFHKHHFNIPLTFFYADITYCESCLWSQLFNIKCPLSKIQFFCQGWTLTNLAGGPSSLLN